MKKNIYRLDGIDCANCGQKMEDKLTNTDGIYNASFVFMLQKLYITYEEPERGFKKIIFPRNRRPFGKK